MPETLHLGCGENHIDGAVNVDVVPTDAADVIHNLNVTPWPFPCESFDRVIAEHVFEHLGSVESALRECERVLCSGGTVRVVWPIGLNQLADPDHKHVWTWKTPEFYCGKRHWDIDVGLRVRSKDAHVWSEYHGPLRQLHNAYLYAKSFGASTQHWKFAESCTSGGFTVVFEKP